MKKLLQHPFVLGFLRALDISGGVPPRRISLADLAGPEADRAAFAQDRAMMGRDLRIAARQYAGRQGQVTLR